MTSTQRMRAAQFRRYGGPEVLQINEVALPALRRDAVLVRTIASSVNRLDTARRAGRIRLLDGPRFPKGTGIDLVGEVADVGDATDVRVGDLVWGSAGTGAPGRSEAAAEYVAVSRRQLSVAPTAIDATSCAALPLVGVTALQSLRDTLRVAPGQRVLISGASGGVGSTAIQLATILGAHVTAICRTDHIDLCTSLGAETVVDYTTALPDDIGAGYDCVLDCSGHGTTDLRRAVRKGGRIATISADVLRSVLATSLRPGPRIRMVVVKVNTTDLTWLTERVTSGDLRPVVAATFPLDAIAEAHRATEAGHTPGKNLVTT